VADLKVVGEVLSESASALGASRSELDGIERRRDEIRDIWGHDEVRGAMHEFASNMDYDVDPVPGDPVAVGVEARHYGQVSAEIADQVAQRRRLSETGGEYADALRESVTELAGNLERIHRRFESTGGALSAYEPELDVARSLTW
jgi:hypothetical protein